MSALNSELRELLNRRSRENVSNTPDFILADYMMACLVAFEKSVEARDTWYGIEPTIPMPDDLNEIRRPPHDPL